MLTLLSKPASGAIITGHPLSDRLVFRCLFNERSYPIDNGSSNAVPLINRVNSNRGTPGGGLTAWSRLDGGALAYVSGNNPWCNFGTDSLTANLTAAPFTIMARLQIGTVLGNTGILERSDGNTAGGAGWLASMYAASPDNYLGLSVEQATTNLKAFAQGPNHGNFFWLTIVYDGTSTAANQKIYLDGQLQTLAGTVVDGVGAKGNDASQSLTLGYASFNVTSLAHGIWFGKMSDVAIWRRKLTTQEIRWVIDDPYANVAWEPKRYRLPAAPPGPTSLCGAETPLIYCELQTDTGPLSWSWVDQPINEPTIQRQPRIVAISKLRRELSDDNGRLVINQGSVTLTDDDGAITAMIAAGTILRKQIDFYGIDDAVRRAGGVPFRLCQYLVTQYKRQPDFTVVLTFEDRFGGDSLRDLLTKPLPFRKFDGLFNPTLPIALGGKGQPIPYGVLSDEDAGYPTVQVWYTGDREHPTLGGTWYEGFIAGCATKGPISAWGWDGATVDVNGNHLQVKLDASLFDSDIAMPGTGSLWAFWSATPYRVINGQRCTVMYLRADSAVGEDFKAFATGATIQATTDDDGVVTSLGVQSVPVHVNLNGIEDVGDSTGDVLTSLPEQWQHLVAQFVEQNHNTDANWYAIPQTANVPAYDVINTDSVALVKAQSEARVTGGVLGAFVIGYDLNRGPLGDVLQRICLGGDFNMGIDRQGRAFLSMEDATVNPVKAFTITSVLEGTYQVDRAWDRVANAVTFNTFKNLTQTNGSVTLRPSSAPQPATWLTGERSYEDGTSIASLGGDPAGRRELVYEDWVTRDVSLVIPNNVAANKLSRLSRGPLLHQIETDLCGLDVELGDLFTITHDAGLSTSKRTVRCTAIEFEPPDPFSKHWAVRLFGYQIGDDAQASVFALVVSGGAGGGVYAEGVEVTITADPPPDGYQFSAWVGATVTSSTSTSTTIVMPGTNVYLRAVFLSIGAGVFAGSGTASGAFVGASTADTGVFSGAGTAAGAFDGSWTVDGMGGAAGATGSFVGRSLASSLLAGAGGASGQWNANGSGRLAGAGTATGLFTSGVVSGHINIAWNANAESDVVGYLVEWGTAPGIYTTSRDVGNVLAYTIPNLVAGSRYYIAIQAKNTSGIYSPNSAEVSAVATA